jgi:hypothetical protein
MSGSPVIVKTWCPPLTSYSKETQRKAARELEKLGDDAATAKFVTDYGKLRDACRAAKARTK